MLASVLQFLSSGWRTDTTAAEGTDTIAAETASHTAEAAADVKAEVEAGVEIEAEEGIEAGAGAGVEMATGTTAEDMSTVTLPPDIINRCHSQQRSRHNGAKLMMRTSSRRQADGPCE
jgi:hypothetical protein